MPFPASEPLRPLAPDALEPGLAMVLALGLDREHGFMVGQTALAAAE